MKVKVKENKIKLIIEIETKEDLHELWHRFNVGYGTLKGESKYISDKHPLGSFPKGLEIFGKLNKLVEDKK